MCQAWFWFDNDWSQGRKIQMTSSLPSSVSSMPCQWSNRTSPWTVQRIGDPVPLMDITSKVTQRHQPGRRSTYIPRNSSDNDNTNPEPSMPWLLGTLQMQAFHCISTEARVVFIITVLNKEFWNRVVLLSDSKLTQDNDSELRHAQIEVFEEISIGLPDHKVLEKVINTVNSELNKKIENTNSYLKNSVEANHN